MTRRTFFVSSAAAIITLIVGLFMIAPSTDAIFQDTKSGKVSITFDIPPTEVTPPAPFAKVVKPTVSPTQKEVVNDPSPIAQPSDKPSVSSPSQSVPTEEPTSDPEKEVSDSEEGVSK